MTPTTKAGRRMLTWYTLPGPHRPVAGKVRAILAEPSE